VPEQVVAALRAAATRPAKRPAAPQPPTIFGGNVDLQVSKATAEFLSGKHSEGPRWNERLFTAACELHARNVPFEKASPLLLAGAKPWNDQEESAAMRTINSAYSQPRRLGFT